MAGNHQKCVRRPLDKFIPQPFVETTALNFGDAWDAAKAALAAVRQDKYPAFHDKLFAFKGNLDDAAIYAMASDLGLDVARLRADMEKPEIKSIIDRSYRLAEKLKIQGTPAFVIGGELLPGAVSFDDLIAVFKRARGG